MNKFIPIAAATAAVAFLAACASMNSRTSDVEVVDSVDLDRYLGTWYEIASFPLRAQRGCVGTTATYSLRDDGDIRVYNRCRKDSFDGKVSDIEGKAWVADESTNAKLKVQFFWPFRSSYWIVDLDEDYQWAVVSGPDRSNLWILSRSPCMSQELFPEIYENLSQRGFDMSRLQSTLQRDEEGNLCRVELPV